MGSRVWPRDATSREGVSRREQPFRAERGRDAPDEDSLVAYLKLLLERRDPGVVERDHLPPGVEHGEALLVLWAIGGRACGTSAVVAPSCATMDDKLLVRLIGVLIGALFIGLITWWRLAIGRARARNALEALGATFHEGASALEVACSQALISAPVSPAWSATLTAGGKRFGIYPLKNGFLVLTWRSAGPATLRFIVRSPPNTGNSKHRDLTPVDINGAFTYGAPAEAVEAFLKGPGAGVFARFRERAGGEGWELLYERGDCSLVRYFVMEDMKSLLSVAAALEHELTAAGAGAATGAGAREEHG